jgi:hypothetical protein
MTRITSPRRLQNIAKFTPILGFRPKRYYADAFLYEQRTSSEQNCWQRYIVYAVREYLWTVTEMELRQLGHWIG